ncbi:putative leucine-rich repeat domain, L domain-containing protein [Rosa chinensis]|uniref:Putative leucine-rich repeat domain, L domain-containing protein n=1 Tax=Rosa chinensis TaxID=74649 RepID=A0A2P6QPB0_ROSCH|nr:putative leucine-rich repeat domain, L domain-containing protein [Rosa chinensis]
MNLRGCESLAELPDFSGMPNLKELDLSDCTSLVKVPDSLGLLDKLVTLKVDHCRNLIMFPRKLNLKSVEIISIRYCKLEEFSEVGEEMGSLIKLDLSGTCIKELHPSITRLIRLEKLDLANNQNLTTLPYNIYELHDLKTLDARGCSKLATFPKIPVKMDSLRQLFLKGSDIRELDESIGNLIGLEELDLSYCKNLTTLPCSIYGLQNLRVLHLGECSKLVRFPTNTKILNVDGCSLSLPKLQAFSIAGCSLLSDCDFLMTLDCWETLEALDLSRNNFVRLPACLTKFVNLGMLDLVGCWRLRGVPPRVADLRVDSLRRFYLEGSDIRELELDESIEDLIGLEKMDLWNCENLTTLPYNIYELHSLESLEVIGCSKLATFPKIPVKMDSLRQLSLKGSDIRELDESIGNLIGLEELDLSYCKNLTTLPCSIYGLHNLKLYASGCSKLVTLPKIPVKMDSLRRFSLEGSDIRELDESIENLIGLEELDLTDCKNLTTLPCSIYRLHNLKSLEASGCSKLATFPKIPVNMDSLRRLSLKGSDIRELDESIGNLIGLEELDLSDCKNLTTLPCSIYGLQHLAWLYLDECSKLVRFPTNTKILNLDECSLSLPKLQYLTIAGCSLLSDCDFLMTLDCWETLKRLDLSRNNFVSLPGLTKFVKLGALNLRDCKRLRGIPELPPNVSISLQFQPTVEQLTELLRPSLSSKPTVAFFEL